jgi:hypothetical protein
MTFLNPPVSNLEESKLVILKFKDLCSEYLFKKYNKGLGQSVNVERTSFFLFITKGIETGQDRRKIFQRKMGKIDDGEILNHSQFIRQSLNVADIGKIYVNISVNFLYAQLMLDLFPNYKDWSLSLVPRIFIALMDYKKIPPEELNMSLDEYKDVRYFMKMFCNMYPNISNYRRSHLFIVRKSYREVEKIYWKRYAQYMKHIREIIEKHAKILSIEEDEFKVLIPDYVGKSDVVDALQKALTDERCFIHPVRKL